MLVGYPPGGSVDLLARALSSELSKSWGQPVIVENRPGAGGVAATNAAARSGPDGHTLLLTDQGPLTTIPFLQTDLPYDPVKDIAAVIGLVKTGALIVVPGNFPATTIADFIAAAKAKPGTLNFGSWGTAGVNHLEAEEFAAFSGISITHVPYKGAAELTRALIAGDVQITFHSTGVVAQQVKGGQLKALAYAGSTRAPLLPEVPTTAEAGLRGFETNRWLGMVASSATPRAIIQKVAADTQRVLADPAFADKQVVGMGFEVYALAPDPFAKLIEETRRKTGALLKRLKLQAN
jgi:tripartite-type tricarboxylate transporter receptor subunit TctC